MYPAPFLMEGVIMAFTDNQKLYAYYVIATVESGCNYASVNMNDPITLGILQWYGMNAYKNVLKPMKTDATDAFELLSDRLKELAGDEGRTWDGWTQVFLNQTDATSFSNAAKLESCRAVQDKSAYSYMFGDGEGGTYGQLKGWGANPDMIQSMVFWMAICHQRPLSASQGLGQIGGNASVEQIHTFCLSNSILSVYRNRYNKVYELLRDWDGVSAPPDFGASDDFVPGGDISDNVDNTRSQISYIQQVGDSLVVHGDMDRTSTLICYKTAGNIWIPQSGTNVAPPGGGGGDTVPPAAEDDPKDFPAMRQLWYDNKEKWYYSQGPNRLNPPSSGYSDCSACIYWAANAATNNKYSWMGTWTGAMLDNTKTVWDGPGSSEIPLNVLRPGDLILMQYSGHGGRSTQHVEWYMGKGVVWGAGSSPLPHHTTDDVTHLLQIFTPKVNHCWINRFLD